MHGQVVRRAVAGQAGERAPARAPRAHALARHARARVALHVVFVAWCSVNHYLTHLQYKPLIHLFHNNQLMTLDILSSVCSMVVLYTTRYKVLLRKNKYPINESGFMREIYHLIRLKHVLTVVPTSDLAG